MPVECPHEGGCWSPVGGGVDGWWSPARTAPRFTPFLAGRWAAAVPEGSDNAAVGNLTYAHKNLGLDGRAQSAALQEHEALGIIREGSAKNSMCRRLFASRQKPEQHHLARQKKLLVISQSRAQELPEAYAL